MRKLWGRFLDWLAEFWAGDGPVEMIPSRVPPPEVKRRLKLRTKKSAIKTVKAAANIHAVDSGYIRQFVGGNKRRNAKTKKSAAKKAVKKPVRSGSR